MELKNTIIELKNSLATLSLKMKGGIKTPIPQKSPKKQKLRGPITTCYTSEEMLQRAAQVEAKGS